MKRRLSLLTATAAALALVALAAFVAVTKAEGPSGVTATVLARGHYDGFNIRSDPHGPIAEFPGAFHGADRHHRATARLCGGIDHRLAQPPRADLHHGDERNADVLRVRRPDLHATRRVGGFAEQCVRRYREWTRRAEPERPARSGHQRDHRAGGRSVPHQSRRAQSLLRLLTSLQTESRRAARLRAGRSSCVWPRHLKMKDSTSIRSPVVRH